MCLGQSITVLVGQLKSNSILGQQIDEARRQGPIVLAGGRDKVGGCPVRRPTLDEVGLTAIGFAERSEVVPTQAKVESKFRTYLPVVLEVRREVVFHVVGLVDVRSLYLIGASRIIDSTRNGRQLWRQEKLRYASGILVTVGNIRVCTVVVELATRICRLQG